MLSHRGLRRGQTSPVPEESAKETVKTIRAGNAGSFGEPVVTTLVCFFHFAYEAAGAPSARHSLRPCFQGAVFFAKPRAQRAGGNAIVCFAMLLQRRPGVEPGPITTGLR
jgi:hypothetical protein